MITRLVTFHVIPKKKQTFINFFYQEYLPAMALAEGYLSAELLQHTELDSDLMMFIRFDSNENSTAWRGSSIHQRLKPKLKALYQGSDLQVLTATIQG